MTAASFDSVGGGFQMPTELESLRAENARLRAALAAAPRWVSVTERLPEDERTRITQLANGQHVIGFCQHGAWFNADNNGESVTHWLELPPAPEAER